MFKRLYPLVLVAALGLFGLSGCDTIAGNGEPTAVPTATNDMEAFQKDFIAMNERIDELEASVNESKARGDSYVEVLKQLSEMERLVEELRNRYPDYTRHEPNTIMFDCVGHVAGYGQADLFTITTSHGSVKVYCIQPGVPRPLDGSKCRKDTASGRWDCGNGQLLKECIDCGCFTPTPGGPPPTAAPPTAGPPTEGPPATAVPPTAGPPTEGPPATAVPPTAGPPATKVPPTVVPTMSPQPPRGTETCEPTPKAKPCDDDVLDTNKREQLPRDEFGTILQTAPNGKHLPLGGQDMVVREEVRMCQIHVVNAWKIHDRITGLTKTGCVVGYRRGISGDDSYHEVNYVASDGYGFHIESRNAGFGLQEGVSQMILALESARKNDGTYACKRAGDQSSERRNAQEIQFMELGLRGP